MNYRYMFAVVLVGMLAACSVAGADSHIVSGPDLVNGDSCPPHPEVAPGEIAEITVYRNGARLKVLLNGPEPSLVQRLRQEVLEEIREYQELGQEPLPFGRKSDGGSPRG